MPFIASTERKRQAAWTSRYHCRDRLVQLAELRDRRNAILKSLIERDLLTPEPRTSPCSKDYGRAEDVYLPYRPKRRTRATIAKEKGLEPRGPNIGRNRRSRTRSPRICGSGKGRESASDAIAGASDIIAERISEDQETRGAMRKLDSCLHSHPQCQADRRCELTKTTSNGKNRYKIPSHRILAMFRGERRLLEPQTHHLRTEHLSC